jgi:hypothetical protein
LRADKDRVSMKDFTAHRLQEDPRARRAEKRPVVVSVKFAATDGVVQTAEGPVRYKPGDALVTGQAGDTWPIEQSQFLDSYEPVLPLARGTDGEYRKRPATVWARRMEEPFTVRVGHAADALTGRPGDWLLQYDPDRYGVVAEDIFSSTYRLLDASSTDAPSSRRDLAGAARAANLRGHDAGDALPPSSRMRYFGWLYRRYLDILHRLGTRFGVAHIEVLPCSPDDARKVTLADADRTATAYGEIYRGIGVAVGLLGALAVLLALVPFMFPMGHTFDLVVAFCEAALMVALGVLLFSVHRGKLKETWIRSRIVAEYLRYDALRAALAYAREQKDEAALSKLQVLVKDVIIGSGGQLDYNRRKLEQYEHIESLTKRATYIAFGCSFVAVLTELGIMVVGAWQHPPAAHPRWLMFFTAALPIFIAAVHGVNGFLRLPQLIAQHAEMATALEQILKRTESGLDRGQWFELTQELLTRLEGCDSTWHRNVAFHQDPLP